MTTNFKFYRDAIYVKKNKKNDMSNIGEFWRKFQQWRKYGSEY